MGWAAGQLLHDGKYQIEEVLGQGGFGITYKALHLQLRKQVVIKTPNESLRRDPDYDKYVERFINEGQILARLSQDPHPHIVRVDDLFQEGEIHCLVMDYIAGENLFDIVRHRGALPEVEVLECFRQIGEALTVVHQAGLVHRDAHPGNIMLRRNGKAILIDFGIAGELVPTTVSSMNPGNGGFAPYEQMSGDRKPTVDVYCLTATLYFARNSLPANTEDFQSLLHTSTLNLGTSNLKLDTSTLKVETPSLKVETPSLKVETPSLKVETPSLKVETPSLKVETPSLKVETPSLKVEITSSEVDNRESY